MFPTKMGLMGSWSKGDSSKDHLRALQLDMRLREVYETYHSFRRLVSSEGGRPKMNDEKADEAKTTKFLESITNRIALENVHLTGHSFGGGTMVSPLTFLQPTLIKQLHLLQTPPPKDPVLAPIPVKRCIALDPWVDPLPIPAPSPEGSLPRVPVLCINSPGFSEWTTHFQRLLKMIKKVDGSFVSLLGASRMSTPPQPFVRL
jgi:platelet-activating factor acetylhydrolase